MADSICARCFHNYVCEQFNENRDYKNQECRYFNSHFVDADSVEPVRHGHWVHDNTWWYPPNCSMCGATLKTPGFIGNVEFYKKYFPRCPNCGAKMDEEVS